MAKKVKRPKPFKQGSAEYHKPRAIVGGALAITGVGAGIGVPYGGYHLYRLGKAQDKNPQTKPKMASKQPQKTGARVGGRK